MLILPLHYYDEAGRVLPPKMLLWLHSWLIKSILIFIGAALMRDSGAEVLAFWYPSKQYLYMSLLSSIPACTSILIVSYRQKLWDKDIVWPFTFLRPSLLLALVLQTGLLLNNIISAQFHFSYTSATSMLLNITAMVYVCKSVHLGTMFHDWRLRISDFDCI